MKNIIIPFLIVLGGYMLISCNEKEKKTGFSGSEITNNSRIIRDKNTKEAFLEINVPGKWEIYGSDSIDNINFSEPIKKGDKTGIFPLNVPTNERFYFELITETGSAILAERHLPMTGGFNFRDLGGIKNKDGKYIKWGKVFRGDELNNLTEDDLNYLSSIPIISIVDFRSEEEIKNAPDKNPVSLKKNYAFSINPGSQSAMTDFDFYDFSKITENQADSFMISLNKLLVIDSVSINRYKDFFKLLQNEDDIPLLFHCTAGKDRTGMGSALFLYSLNVDEDIIFNNYLDSNEFLESKYSGLKTKYPQLSAFFEVKPEFLKAGIDQIKKDHGTVENYLIQVLDVNLEKMQKIYLY